jgi:hypothetical protein
MLTHRYIQVLFGLSKSYYRKKKAGVDIALTELSFRSCLLASFSQITFAEE